MSIRSHERGIIVGVDGTSSSREALTWALGEAALRRCKLRIVHADVLSTEAAAVMREGTEIVDREVTFALNHAPNVEVESELHDAFTVPALIAEGAAAEMIIVGNRGRGGFASVMLGSVGVHLAAHAPCPVVIVRHSNGRPGPEPSADRVVVGLDGSPMSELALEFALLEASLRKSGLTAVHVAPMPVALPSWGVPEPPIGAEDDVEREKLLLAESLAGWQEKYRDVDIIQKTPLGHAGEALIHEARGAQLVVVGSRGRGGFRGLLLGSTSQALMHHAPCPVAVVRHS